MQHERNPNPSVTITLISSSILLTALLITGLFSRLMAGTRITSRVANLAPAGSHGLLIEGIPGDDQRPSHPDGEPSQRGRDVITYHFANCPRSLDCEMAFQAVREAFDTWEAACGIRLEEAPGDGDIRIAWVSGEHSDETIFDGPGGTLAHASDSPTSEVGWVIHFDDGEVWVVWVPRRPYPEEIHLPTVALHEIGHALGLPHSDNPGSIMWAEYTGIRGLAEEDITAARLLYGLPPDTME